MNTSILKLRGQFLIITRARGRVAEETSSRVEMELDKFTTRIISCGPSQSCVAQLMIEV